MPTRVEIVKTGLIATAEYQDRINEVISTLETKFKDKEFCIETLDIIQIKPDKIWAVIRYSYSDMDEDEN